MLWRRCLHSRRGYQKIRRRDFQNVDYLYYILVTLAIMAFCLYLMGVRGFTRVGSDEIALNERARKRRKKEHVRSPRNDRNPERYKVLMNRGAQNIPTPWGWPGYGEKADLGHSAHSANNHRTAQGHVVSDSLHRWVDHLVSEKRTVDDQDYLLKREASVRALLEDRYGRTLKAPVDPDRFTRPPQLNGRGNKTTSKLKSEPGKLPGSGVSLTSRSKLKEVKTPWGW